MDSPAEGPVAYTCHISTEGPVAVLTMHAHHAAPAKRQDTLKSPSNMIGRHWTARPCALITATSPMPSQPRARAIAIITRAEAFGYSPST